MAKRDSSKAKKRARPDDQLRITREVAGVAERRRPKDGAARLASFPLHNPNPIVEADLAGRVIFVNPAARHLFPDLEQAGTGHPWLSDWKTVVAACEKDSAQLPAREVAVGGR